jgi:hypothetical protein
MTSSDPVDQTLAWRVPAVTTQMAAAARGCRCGRCRTRSASSRTS